MDFGFLSNITFAPNTKTARTYNKKERNPITADLRLFRDGSIYPSQALVEKFNLEYKADGSGNGFDVIDSRKMSNTAAIAPAFLMIAPVAKGLPKVDMFAAVTMKDGKPATSVMEQGAKTFGQTLLTMIAEVYGVTTTEEKDFIDLNIVENQALAAGLQQATNGIYFIPKVVARGEKKGQPDYARRENIVLSILVPAAVSANQEGTSAASLEHDEYADADAQLANSYAEQSEVAHDDLPFLP